MSEIKKFCQQHGISLESETTTPFTQSQLVFGEMDGLRVVVKGGHDMSHEWKGQVLAKNRGVLVPQSLLLSLDKQFMVSSELMGSRLDQVDQDLPRFKLGQIIRRMNNFKPEDSRWDFYGCSSMQFYADAMNKWNQIEILNSGSTVQGILKILSTSIISHWADVKPGFAHRDMFDEQAVVTSDGVGIFDFDSWGDSDLYREISFYLFHKIRRSEPLSGFNAFYQGASGNEQMSTREAEVIAFYTLFISANALRLFTESDSPYASIALQTFINTLNFVESEKLFK